MKNQDTELKTFLQKAGKPRDSFVSALEKKVLDTHSSGKQPNLLSTVLMAFTATKKQLVIGGGLAFLAVTAIFVTGGMYLWQKQQANEMNAILAEIANANLEARQRDSQSEAKLSATMDAARLIYIDPKTRGYTYRKSVETYSWGSQAASCAASFPFMTEVSSVEHVELFSSADLQFPDYTLNIIKDRNNSITSYELHRPRERYTYAGGSYAVKVLNPLTMNILALTREGGNEATGIVADDMKTLPVEGPQNPQQPTDPNEVIRNYFGENAKVIGKETREGKEVYKIEYASEFFCAKRSRNPEVSAVDMGPAQKQIIIAYFDTKSFLAVEEQFYVNSVSNQNMLYTRKVAVDQGNQAIAEVSSQFEFTLNVPVTTVDQAKDNYQGKYNAAMRDLLQKEGIQLFSGPWSISSQGLYSGNIRIIVDSEKHLYDRNFYAKTTEAQEQYDAMVQSQRPSNEKFQSLITQTVATTDTTVTAFNVDVYSLSDREVIDHLKSQRGDSSSGTEAATTLSINGAEVPATLIANSEARGVSADSTMPSAPDRGFGAEGTTLSIKTYVVAYRGKTYVFTFTVNSKDPADSIKPTMRTLDTVQISAILSKMEEEAKNTPVIMY